MIGGLAGLLSATAAAPAAISRAPRIDVHAHHIPAFYRRAVQTAGLVHPDGIPDFPAWDENAMLGLMDRAGISTAILSISSPGVYFGDQKAAASLARAVNEDCARMRAAHGTRFGFFASLPLPDIDAALAEADHALDRLGADGIAMLTNIDGIYLGDRRLDPLYQELDRRGAVVFVHPTSPKCTECEPMWIGVSRTTMEFFFETARAIESLVMQRVPQRFPRIRFIMSHCGGALSSVYDRFLGIATPNTPGATTVPPEEVAAMIASLYFDVASKPLPRVLPAMLQIAPATHFLYGDDIGFTREQRIIDFADAFDQTPLLDAETRSALYTGNARRLFPRLAALDKVPAA